MKKAIYS